MDLFSPYRFLCRSYRLSRAISYSRYRDLGGCYSDLPSRSSLSSAFVSAVSSLLIAAVQGRHVIGTAGIRSIFVIVIFKWSLDVIWFFLVIILFYFIISFNASSSSHFCPPIYASVFPICLPDPWQESGPSEFTLFFGHLRYATDAPYSDPQIGQNHGSKMPRKAPDFWRIRGSE